MVAKESTGVVAMSLEEFRTLLKWLRNCGARTAGDLKAFIETYTNGKTEDILNKAHGCFVFDLDLF